VIVGAVIGLGRSLGLRVTAEGVESRNQERHLRRLGCGDGQGFLYSVPVPGCGVPPLLLRSL